MLAGMDPFGDDDIAQLLRLKRYEQPPASYYETFLSEFRRRQRDELLRQPVWTGSQMIVWGGYDGSSYFNTGGRNKYGAAQLEGRGEVAQHRHLPQ
jgi:hypothetical protein